MTTPQYFRLERSHESNSDVPLSRFSSEHDRPKEPVWQNTNLSQNSVPGRKKRGFRGAINGWWLELGSVVLAFAVMLVTIVLLAHYNGMPLDETPRKPSLNTIVNIFSAIEAGLIVYVAAEILSQSKWHRMQTQAPLDDFNVIDNASRGIKGSVQVLFKPWLGPMSLIGALTTLLAVVIGPMLQETVTLRDLWLANPDRNATVPISKFFAPDTNPELPKLDIGMKGTILNGLSSTNISGSTPAFGCPSGNCTYDTPYTSLGICSSCQKLNVTRQCNEFNNCNYTLANGHVLLNSQIPNFFGDFQFINVSTAFSLDKQMAIPDNDVTEQFDVVRASIISLTNGPICHTNGTNPDCVLDNRDNATLPKLFDGGAIGAYCDLALCTNTYTANVTESSVSERIIASTDARNMSTFRYSFEGTDSAGLNHSNPVILPDQCYIDGQAYDVDDYKDSKNNSWTYIELTQGKFGDNSTSTTKVPVDCAFSMRAVTYQSMFQFMTSNPFFLDGSGVSDSNTGVAGGLFSFYSNGPDNGLPNVAAFGVEPIFNNGNASFDSIDATFKQLASAMTTYMRENSGHQGSSDFTGLEKQLSAINPSSPGVLFRSQTVVTVQWYWTIVPLIVLVVICAYLTAAIVQGGVKDYRGNTQAHLWKSNILVPLVIGNRSQLPGSADVVYGYNAMQDFKQRQMQLVSSKDGWVFVESSQNNIA